MLYAPSHLFTKGSYLAPGLHGTTPSGTSSYFSVDIGLIHITVSGGRKTPLFLDRMFSLFSNPFLSGHQSLFVSLLCSCTYIGDLECD